MIDWAFRQTQISSPMKFVLLALANYADPAGRCWPSYSKVAELTNMCRRAVINNISKLEESGLLTIEKRPTNGKHLSSIYQLSYSEYRSPSNGALDSPPSAPDAPLGSAPDAPYTVNINTVIDTIHGAIVNGDPPARMPDPAYKLFTDLHQELKHTAYVHHTKDFVHLAALRKANNVATGELPEHWEYAVRNYLSSNLANFTVADLCTKFAVFCNHSVDRYGKRVEDQPKPYKRNGVVL